MNEGATLAATRRQQVVEVARGVFLRYGYARTTMADIAHAAGLSRPTLYLTFSDKEEVFQAVVEAMVADKIAEIRQSLPGCAGLDAKLRYACKSWGAEGFDLVQANPDAKDMFDRRFKAVCDGFIAFEAVLIEILEEPLRNARLDVQAGELARVIGHSIKGLKDVARDGADIRRMIDALITMIAAGLEA
jgi:AcrR family transcriptional regulator